MHTFASIIAATALILTSSLFVSAEAKNKYAPGQQMNDKEPLPGYPGASGYAPGHQTKCRAGHPGASGCAPGHRS